MAEPVSASYTSYSVYTTGVWLDDTIHRRTHATAGEGLGRMPYRLPRPPPRAARSGLNSSLERLEPNERRTVA